MILKQLFSLEIVLTGSVHRKPIWRIEGFVCVCVLNVVHHFACMTIDMFIKFAYY